MQTGPIQKGPSIHGNSRANARKTTSQPVKRRDMKTEVQDTVLCLEDRIRALTTIEEEDSSFPGTNRGLNVSSVLEKLSLNDGKNGLMQNTTGSLNEQYNSKDIRSTSSVDSNSSSDFYRAIPTEAISDSPVSPCSPTDKELNVIGFRAYTENTYDRKGINGITARHTLLENTEKGWIDYSSILEKDYEIPMHNMNTVTHGKLTNSMVKCRETVGISRQMEMHSSLNARKARHGFSQNTDEGNKEAVSSDRTDQGFSQMEPGQSHGVYKSSNEQEGEIFIQDTSTGCSPVSGRAHDHIWKNNHPESIMPDLISQNEGLYLRQMPHLMCKKKPVTEELPDQKMQLLQFQGAQSGFQTQSSPSHVLKNSSPLFNKNFMNFGSGGTSLLSADPPHRFSPNVEIHNPSSQDNPDFRQSGFHVVESAAPASLCPAWDLKQPDNKFYVQHLEECDRLKMGLEQNSLNLENIPRLQKQIKATSELCLQASRKHTFASSADIHKLFSGQRRSLAFIQASSSNSSDTDPTVESYAGKTDSPLLMTRFPKYPQTVEASPTSQAQLKIMVPSLSPMEVSPSDLHRVHPNNNTPLKAWTSVTSLPNSSVPENDRISSLRHLHFVPSNSDLDRQTFETSLPTSVIPNADRSQTRYSSSEYSSENELQQIETNAKTMGNFSDMQGQETLTSNSAQEFMSQNGSINQDSTLVTDNSDLLENEPVYENQSLLERNYASETLNEHIDSTFYAVKASALSNPCTNDAYCMSPHTSTMADYHYFELPRNAHLFINNPNITSCYSMSNRAIKTDFTDHINYQNRTSHTINHLAPEVSHLDPGSFHGYYLNSDPAHSTSTSSFTEHINILGTMYPNSLQHHPMTHELPAFTSSGYQYNTDLHSQNDQYFPQGGQSQHQNNFHDSTHRKLHRNFVSLSPKETSLVLLEIPFETTIISDEQGDRLSTLV